MEEFTIGDVVELKSGSAQNLMTVMDIIDDRGTKKLKVSYEDRGDWNKLKTELFPAATLKVYVAPIVVSREEDYSDI
jgi:uncharacterized protein YodC (DUF2158 family)